jgi:hypothetical protein
LLQRRLAQVRTLTPPPGEAFRTLLERTISISRGLFPAVSDLAHELRYRCFDQPLFDRARKQIYAEAEGHLDYLAAHPDAADRHERMRALIECPQPLATILSGRFATASAVFRRLMLEILISRYYLVRTLSEFRTVAMNGHACVSAEYEEAGNRIHIFASHTEYQQLAEAMKAIVPFVATVPANEEVVLDFFTWRQHPLAEPDVAQAEIHSVINQTDYPRSVRHILVAVSGAGRDPGLGGMQHFTFEPSADGYEEVK